MQEQTKPEEVELNLCDPDVFQKVIHDSSRGNAILFVGKETCPVCPEVLEAVGNTWKEELAKRNLTDEDEATPMLLNLEITDEEDAKPREPGSCAYFADSMKVEQTPTVIVFQKEKEVARVAGRPENAEALKEAVKKAFET